ncbi:MAG: GIY-YIG nuclease family protein [Bacilli bacterium]
MNKDIYIIKNTVNNKVYIGQAIDTHKRFISHCSRAKINKDNSPLHDAIHKYGKEKFYYEILEHQISNYNEKEQYWIKYYNSLVPYGYNLLKGGNDPPYHRGEECPNAVITQEIAKNIINDLLNSSLKIKQIAYKYNIEYSLVRHINYGESWKDSNLNYPLRKKDERYSIEENSAVLNQIYWLLEYSSCSTEQIGAYFKVGRKTVDKINNGKTHFCQEREYPIRKKRKRSSEEVEEALIRGGLI